MFVVVKILKGKEGISYFFKGGEVNVVLKIFNYVIHYFNVIWSYNFNCDFVKNQTLIFIQSSIFICFKTSGGDL